MIISLSGIDAGGKGVQTERLRQHLTKRGIVAEAMHFPVYESVTGREIKRFLTGEVKLSVGDDSPLDRIVATLAKAVTLQALMTANRLEHLDRLFADEHTHDSVLICDRYTACAVAYGMADGLERAFIDKLNETLPIPHLAILIDITVDESWKRRPKRDDQYEANRGRLERVRQNYLDYFDGHGARSIVDGMRPPEAVAADIARIVDDVIEFYGE